MLSLRLTALSCSLLLAACSQSADTGGSSTLGGSTSSQSGTGTGTGAGTGGFVNAGGTASGIGGLVVDPADPGGEETRALPECVSCQWTSCPDGKHTTISGVVRTPAKVAADPLYNAVVYVPGAKLDPFPETVSCDRCGNVSGKPLAAALSGSDGSFTLEDVPAGQGIPLVLQMGRWRREVVIPEIVECEDNPLPAELTRFPRNRAEGDIPRMALVSSSFDPEECILRKIGIDDAEFTAPSDAGRIHLYRGNGVSNGPETPRGAELWGDSEALARYDMVLLPCSSTPEGGPIARTSGQEPRRLLADYADAGGRIFATDLSFTWLTAPGSPFADTARWIPDPENDYAHLTLQSSIDTTFPKGQALADWLQGLGATTTSGEITLHETYERSLAVNAPTQRWLYSEDPGTLQSFTFNTPLSAPAEQQCGRFAYSSFHVAGALPASIPPFPRECDDEPLTPQERVLEFMLFDLASCVQIDTSDPKPPVVPK